MATELASPVAEARPHTVRDALEASEKHECTASGSERGSLSTRENRAPTQGIQSEVRQKGICGKLNGPTPRTHTQEVKSERDSPLYRILGTDSKYAGRVPREERRWLRARARRHLSEKGSTRMEGQQDGLLSEPRVLSVVAEEPMGALEDWGYAEKEVAVRTAYADLSLFCPMLIGNATAGGLVDCGAGTNLGNREYFRMLLKHRLVSPDDLQITKDKLTVRVANSQRWELNEKARLRYKIGNTTFVQDFWLAPELQEDVLLGMPALRNAECSLNIGRVSEEDSILLRETGEVVQLQHLPFGRHASCLRLSVMEHVHVPSGRAVRVRAFLRGAHGVYWGKQGAVTGLVGPYGRNRLDRYVRETLNEIDEDGGTYLVVRNHSASPCQLAPGDVIGRFQPMEASTLRDDQGAPLLFVGLDGCLHQRVEYRLPGTTLDSDRVARAPLSPLPVGVLRVREANGVRTESVEALSDHALATFVGRVAVRDVTVTDVAPDVKETEEKMDEKVGQAEQSSEYTWRDVKINPELTPDETARVVEMLKRHAEFFDSIQESYPNPRLPEWTKLTIKLREGSSPWRSRAYPLSAFKRERMREKVAYQLSKGFIRHSASPYASPAFLVSKSSGGWRLVQDCRQLNANIEQSSWPIPRISEILDKLKGARYFTSIDLADGFHQIGIDEESKKYTAFITEDGLYELNTCPMGLSTSPNHFQFVLDRILGGMGGTIGERESSENNLVGSDCFVYVDDVLVYSSTLQEHLDKLDRVICRLKRFGLRGKSPKINMAMFELKFLGHVLSAEGRRPCPEKIKAIQEIPTPRSKKQVQALLGIAGYYMKFVKDFEGRVMKLRELTADRVQVSDLWTQEHQEALDGLKEAMTSAPILSYPDFDEPFLVKTDSSKTRIGGVLAQIQEGKERVIEYLSKKLTKRQRHWHMTHLEGWAVVYCLTKWARYLEGRKDTKLIVDHKALLWLRRNKYSDCSGKLIRWFAYIDSFAAEFEHRRTEDHGDVDGLTRCYEDVDDVRWEDEDTGAEWVYELLCRYIQGKFDLVREVRYQGPAGGNTLEAQGFSHVACVESEMTAWSGGDQADLCQALVVAVPPSNQVKLRNLFDGLRRKGCSWAVWAPVQIVQASYFREPEVEIIFVRGELGYGATTRGIPLRCAWITHGLGMGRNVVVRAVERKGVVTLREEGGTGASIRYIRSDWGEWALQDQPPVREEASNQMDSFHHVVSQLFFGAGRSMQEWARGKGVWSQLFSLGSVMRSGPRAQDEIPEEVYPHVAAVTRQGAVALCGGAAAYLPVRGLQVDEPASKDAKSEEFTIPPEVRSEMDRLRAERESLADLHLAERKTGNSTVFELASRALEAEEKALREEDLGKGVGLAPIPLRVISRFQQRCEECKEIRERLRAKPVQDEGIRHKGGGRRQYYYWEHGCIWWGTEKGKRLFVPRALRYHLLHLYHRSKIFAHPGAGKMYATMSRSYGWPGMKGEIEKYVSSCLACVRAKATQPHRHGGTLVVVPERPFSVVGIDIYGPFPITAGVEEDDRGYQYVLSVVDHYSRWIRLLPMRDAPTASTVAESMVYRWMKDFGVPEMLVMDKDSVFRAQLTQEVGKLLGIRMHTFPAESQWRNGRVERVHRYLGERLRLWKKQKHRSWHKLLVFIEMSHHFLVMPQFGLSPYEVLYGREPNLPFTQRNWVDSGHPSQAYMFVRGLHRRLREVQRIFHERDMEESAKRLKKRRASQDPAQLRRGDRALVFTRGTKDKLTCLWSDEVEVTARVNDTTFEVRHANGRREEVSAQRLRRLEPGRDMREEVLGPFVTDYPSLEAERGPQPAEPIAEVAISKNLAGGEVGRKLRVKDGEVKEESEQRKWIERIRHGDFVAYYEEAHGWGIGQYLGELAESKGFICLRYLDNYSRRGRRVNPRQYVWRYHWTADTGPDVLARTRASPDDKPRAKNTGGLEPTLVDVAEEDIICVVRLTEKRNVDNDSWVDMLRRVDLSHPGAMRFFVGK